MEDLNTWGSMDLDGSDLLPETKGMTLDDIEEIRDNRFRFRFSA